MYLLGARAGHLLLVASGSSNETVDLTSFAQYGAVGFVAIVALLAVRALYKRREEDWEQREKDYLRQIDREQQRGDRLEQELNKLNATLHDNAMHALNDATRMVAEAIGKLRRER